MRITSQIPIDSSSNSATFQRNDKVFKEASIDSIDVQNQLPTATFQKAVDALNDFMKVHNSNLKFIYHEGLKEYYVEIVDSQTEEVIKEIPSKELLDAYYQMQKIIGNIVDKKI